MEPNTPEQSFDESLSQVIATLPPVLKRYLAAGNVARIAGQLVTKYRLHVDQGGVLEREMNLLLLGVEDPNEFAASLKSDANMPEDTVLAILTDLNQEVFTPLQAQMRAADKATLNPPVSVPAAVPRYTPPVPSQQEREPLTPPVLPAVQMPAVATATPTPVVPTSPKPVEDHIVPYSAPLPPKTVLPSAGAPTTIPTNTPKVVPPPANLPGTPEAEVSVNRLAGRTVPVQQPPVIANPTPVPKTTPTSPSTRTYTVDPYRELPDTDA